MDKINSLKFFSVIPKGWRFFIIAVLIIGIFFRLLNIDKKVYWVDETDSLMRISGGSKQEVVKEVFNGEIITAEALQANYQTLVPEKNIVNMFQALSEDTHPPFYFILSRSWFQLVSPWLTSVTATRSLSVFLSFLVFPALYWLCLELFNSPFIGYIALTIVAISPVHVLYAQEARLYTLWILLTILSSASLLRAMKLQTNSSWFLYALMLSLNCYTYLFSALVAIGQGIYVLIIEKLRFSKNLIRYLLSSLFAFLLAIPWMITIAMNWDNFRRASSWIEGGNSSVLNLLIVSFNNIINSFVDFWFIYVYFPDLTLPNLRMGIIIKPLLLILIAYSIYFLCRRTHQRVWLFVLTLIGTTPAILLLKDIMSNSSSVTQARYLIPSYVGIQIAIAYLLGSKCLESKRTKMWRLITILLISAGILSISISSQAETWSNKYNHNQHEVAGVINQKTNPVLIIESSPIAALSLSHHLKPKTSLLLLRNYQQLDITNLSDNYQEIFLYKPSKEIKETFRQDGNYKVVSVKNVRGLWKVSDKN